MTNNEKIRDEALRWYQRTNTTPDRQISEEDVLKIYIKTKDYADSDPLLSGYYRSNHLK
ncbi:MAG: hypothetical protein HQM13_03570 [SAR324 cluster bacterium]|nr:hypothetical protein [SAR324 cluster bacterium]